MCKVSLKIVLMSEAYILFYEREDTRQVCWQNMILYVASYICNMQL